MIWIIEGADMTGKTMLANKLKEKYNLTYEHIHTNPYEYYKETLTRDNYVYDRHIISEMLYPRVFGREPKINWGQFQELIEVIKENKDKIKIVILTADDVEFLTRLNERPDEPDEVVSTLIDIDREFRAVGTLFDIKVVNAADFTLENIEEMLK